jgi:hypothetical protein
MPGRRGGLLREASMERGEMLVPSSLRLSYGRAPSLEVGSSRGKCARRAGDVGSRDDRAQQKSCSQSKHDRDPRGRCSSFSSFSCGV